MPDYSPKYVELYDETIRAIVEKSLNSDLTQTHYVSHVVRMDGNKWIVRLDYSITKGMQSAQSEKARHED